MKEKTFIKIDLCEKIVDDVLMKTTECSHEEISRIWYHTKDNLSIGVANYVCLPNSKKINEYYVIWLSRTTNKDESADKLYIATKPKGGARCHKKKDITVISE